MDSTVYITLCYRKLYGETLAKILLDLTSEEGMTVEVYKAINKLKTKQDAIKQMIAYFTVEVKPRNIKEKDYFST